MQLLGRMCVLLLISLSAFQQDNMPRAANQNITGYLSHNVRYKVISRTEEHSTKYCGVCSADTTIFLGTDAHLPRRYLKPWKTQTCSNK
jgi:hypothetical protein